MTDPATSNNAEEAPASPTSSPARPTVTRALGSFLGDGTPEVDDERAVKGDLKDLGVLSETASISSSLYEHVEENGRTYHRYKQGQYPLPNDEPEQDRLDFQHRLFRLSLDGKLYMAPVGDAPKYVLDIATGTGAWAIDFANEHPKSNVTGTDLSPIQPAYIPPNCTFLIDDAEDAWTFPHPFDFIHARAIVTCFRDPRSVFAHAFDALVPGGWFEVRDPVFPLKFASPPPPNSPLAQWNDLVIEAAAKSGRPWTNAQYYKQWLIELGFEDVQERFDFATTSPWAKGKRSKYLSVWFQHDLLLGIEGWSMALFTRVLGWEKQKVMDLLQGVKRDLRDTGVHCYSEGRHVWGRKPFNA